MAPASNRPDLIDGPAIRAELVFLAIIAAMSIVLLTAGLPGGPEAVAGNGSEKLRKGWADSRRGEVQAPVDVAGSPAPVDVDSWPTGRGRDPSSNDPR